ncbi:hypothetical protein TD95_003991 [Thielaviopsis punctulata]|uniref:DNA-directed RNA polymerase I subunit RPA12 n=1 Tax=Thielaviopsis punctulata TaxID=72032 RepID=A0A0F4Z6P3_9PEZI|nr:hypothetical protein TD95_003991 [Thielaviopsis punctulata]
MAAIGSLVFCNMCGNLLPASKGTTKGILRCDACHSENRDVAAKVITTETKATDFPSQLRQKLQSTVKAVASHEISTMATINERCPKCSREEVRYTAVQLRSADEGSTIFYYCECGHKYVFSFILQHWNILSFLKPPNITVLANFFFFFLFQLGPEQLNRR